MVLEYGRDGVIDRPNWGYTADMPLSSRGTCFYTQKGLAVTPSCSGFLIRYHVVVAGPGGTNYRRARVGL